MPTLVFVACAGDGGDSTGLPSRESSTTRSASSVGEQQASWDLVAIGDSMVAGEGVWSEEVYTRRYAVHLGDELDVTVDVHDYGSGELRRTVAVWNEIVGSDESLRADLAEAEIVLIFLGFHNIGLVTLGPDGCEGDWPDPLETCLREGTASMPADYDQLFAQIRELVPAEATILVGYDGGLPMEAPLFQEWLAEPFWPEIKRILVDDWRPGLYAAAAAHDAIVIPWYEAMTGPNDESLHPEFLTSDGGHFNAQGHRFLAELHLANDGLGND
jgi:hypothetical protein